MELKRKFKYRLMLDETWSFGTLGKTGRGLSELYDIPVSVNSSWKIRSAEYYLLSYAG